MRSVLEQVVALSCLIEALVVGRVKAVLGQVC